MVERRTNRFLEKMLISDRAKTFLLRFHAICTAAVSSGVWSYRQSQNRAEMVQRAMTKHLTVSPTGRLLEHHT